MLLLLLFRISLENKIEMMTKLQLFDVIGHKTSDIYEQNKLNNNKIEQNANAKQSRITTCVFSDHWHATCICSLIYSRFAIRMTHILSQSVNRPIYMELNIIVRSRTHSVCVCTSAIVLRLPKRRCNLETLRYFHVIYSLTSFKN